MALIDLKSKLNRFSSEKDNPNKPYQRFGNDITDLENSPRPDIDREKFLENGQKLESNLTNVDSELDRQNTPKSNKKFKWKMNPNCLLLKIKAIL